MNVEIKQGEKKITVSVSIGRRKRATDDHKVVSTENVLDFLQKDGYTLDEWQLVQEDICSTGGKEQKLNGTWVLERRKKNETVQSKQPKRPSSNKRRSTSPRTKKTTPELLRTENMGRVQSQAQTDLPRQDKQISGQ